MSRDLITTDPREHLVTQRPRRTTTSARTIALSATVIATILSAQPGIAGVGVDASALMEAVTVDGIKTHLDVFQDIADANDGVREASSNGYFQSVLYVSEALSIAGYDVDVQIFPFTFFEDTTPPELQQISPTDTLYTPDDDEGFASLTYSGSGEVTATAQAVDVMLPAAADANSSTSGCEAEDFADFQAGNIALVQRGSCSFFLKALNAEQAGAVGVVIFNEGQDGRTSAFGGTLGQAGVTIPVVGASFEIGNTLAAQESVVRLKVDAITETRISGNVIADTPIGAAENTVVVGAHLDSVAEGPGINDNGSGTAAILEVALQMGNIGLLDDEDTGIRNRVRFAFWGAEELGLLGSEYYVATLPDAEFEQIMANLNFDMIGSPNFARFVYDGDGSASVQGGPEGSAFIEWMFNDYFQDVGLANEPTAFDGRSDYGPFIAAGIPAGGLFTGAEDIKTESQAAIYGGTAGEAYDPCYHEACDTNDNLSLEALDEMSDAVAYSVNVLAVNRLPVPNAVATARSNVFVDATNSSSDVMFDYDGKRLQR